MVSFSFCVEEPRVYNAGGTSLPSSVVKDAEWCGAQQHGEGLNTMLTAVSKEPTRRRKSAIMETREDLRVRTTVVIRYIWFKTLCRDDECKVG